MNIINLNRIYNSVYHSGDPDRSKGFAGWQHKAQITRKALLQAKLEMDAQLAEWRETYTEKAIEPMFGELLNEYHGIRDVALRKLEDELNAVVDEKRGQYEKIALTAPSDEQLRLIQALSYRDDLTDSEVAQIAEKMNGSLQALKALGSVARKAGLDFPHTVSTEDFERAVDEAVQYAHTALFDIDTPQKELGYNSVCFYEYSGVGLPHAVFDPLDSPMFAAVQSGNESTEKHPLPTATSTDEGKDVTMWSRVTLGGNESLSTIAAQFHTTTAAIRQANPQANLDRLYSGQKIYVPSTRMMFQPDPSGGHVQPDHVEAVAAPSFDRTDEIGNDIDICSKG